MYTIKINIISLYESICRFFYYGWKMRNSYEFDSHSILQAEYAAAYRLLKFMESNKTHCMWTSLDNKGRESNLMRKLREYVGLLHKQLNYSYTRNYRKAKIRIHGDTAFDIDNFFKSTESKYERVAISSAIRRDHKELKEDLDRYNYLRVKYMSHFWD